MDRLAVKEPYFFSNNDWYYYDNKKIRFILTDKATEKAKQSYYEFYGEIDNND